MTLRGRILALNRAGKWAKTLDKQTSKMRAVQLMADKEAEKNPDEKWECPHCHDLVPIKEYPKHYFKCEMADKLPKVMPK